MKKKIERGTELDDLDRQYKKLDRLIKTYSEHAQDLLKTVRKWQIDKQRIGKKIARLSTE